MPMSVSSSLQQLEMEIAQTLPVALTAKPITSNQFERVKCSVNCGSAFYLGRQREPFRLVLLQPPTTITTNNVRSSGGESFVEIQPMVENGSTDTVSPSEGIGHLVNKSSKWVVAIIVAAVLIWRHDAHAMWAVTGSILNGWNSILLKIFFNQQRPLSALGLKADPGMPSSHAQSLGYLTVYAALALIGWQGLNSFSIGVGFVILICGTFLAWLRVSEGLHTSAQFLVGELLGSVSAIIWFWLWKAIMLKVFNSSFWVQLALISFSLIAILQFLFFIVERWHFGEV